jgi:hypothetical protein
VFLAKFSVWMWTSRIYIIELKFHRSLYGTGAALCWRIRISQAMQLVFIWSKPATLCNILFVKSRVVHYWVKSLLCSTLVKLFTLKLDERKKILKYYIFWIGKV